VSFHGTDDPLVPYAGGTLFASIERMRGRATGASKVTVKPTEDQLALWAQRNGCTAGPSSTAITAQVTRIDYADCTHNADTTLYRIEGGGHTWPGGPAAAEQVLGVTTQDIDATATILDFFDDHPWRLSE
jgi:polyhydroxybutyrate depolymerase